MLCIARHCLIRASVEQVIVEAKIIHPLASYSSIPGWRYGSSPPPGRHSGWITDTVMGEVAFCVETEPGANGALVHLTTYVLQSPWSITTSVHATLVGRHTARQLARLKVEVENQIDAASATATDPRSQIGNRHG